MDFFFFFADDFTVFGFFLAFTLAGLRTDPAFGDFLIALLRLGSPPYCWWTIRGCFAYALAARLCLKGNMGDRPNFSLHFWYELQLDGSLFHALDRVDQRGERGHGHHLRGRRLGECGNGETEQRGDEESSHTGLVGNAGA